MLLDADTLELASGVERLLGPEGLKTELFSCLVETNTPVCESAAEARDELVRLRAVVRDAAGREGLAVAAAGSHPFSRGEDQEIVAEPRYLKMLEELGPKLHRQLVCGLHVHVGMESFDACLQTLAAIVPWLPTVLALSLNSPYIAGRGDGRALVSSGTAGRAAAGRRGAAVLRIARGMGGLHRGDREGLHAQLVGCAASSTARDARGEDRRPADERRARRGAGCAGPGALRGASDGAAHGRVLGGAGRCGARLGAD